MSTFRRPVVAFCVLCLCSIAILASCGTVITTVGTPTPFSKRPLPTHDAPTVTPAFPTATPTRATQPCYFFCQPQPTPTNISAAPTSTNTPTGPTPTDTPVGPTPTNTPLPPTPTLPPTLDLSDRSGHSNMLTNHGAILSSSVPSGLAGSIRSAELGSGSYLEAQDSPSLDITGALTIEGWVYITGVGGDQFLVNKFETGDLSNQGYIQSNQSILMDLSATGAHNPGNGYGFTAANVVPFNTWTHLAFVYDQSTVALYVNGVAVATTQSSVPNSIHAGNSTLKINYTSSGIFRVDDIRIWATARSASQIANNRNTQLTGSEPGLVAYYPF